MKSGAIFLILDLVQALHFKFKKIGPQHEGLSFANQVIDTI